MKRFRDGIAFAGWHHFGDGYGTAIRAVRVKPGVFGVKIEIGSVLVGAWWTWRIELVAVHPRRLTNQ